MTSAVTLADVAARAGVSTATVSRVVNGNYPVSAATRKRVERAISDLGYVANAHARALAGTSNRTVGIIVNELVDPFFGFIARGVEREASAVGRICLVCCTHGDSKRELTFIDLLHEQRADVVVLVGGAVDDPGFNAEVAKRARALDARGSKLALCGRPSIGEDVPTVLVEYDNEGGAFAITDYLINQGHRRILYVGGLTALSTTRARIDGYQRALRMRDIDSDPALVRTGAPFSRVAGYEAVREVLREGLDFTAVFAANDNVATGVVQALEEAGLDIPGDVSVAGYDDVPVAEQMRPTLTTVRVPLEEMGRQAIRLALANPDDFESSTRPGIRLGTHIIVRDSVRGR